MKLGKGLFVSGLVVAAVSALVLPPESVSAQPATRAPATPAKDGGAAVTKDGGAAKATATSTGGADAGASGASGAKGDAGTSASSAVTSATDGGAATAPAFASTTDGGAPSLAAPAPTFRKMHPPPPPPTPEQVAALGALKEEVDAFEQGGKDYRDTVTTIIRLHYESKKREVLSGLDREIAIEKAELKKARDIAIKRLEEFIENYKGPRSQPEATPDAMYRLAALYEERARSEEATDPVEVGLKQAIALYKRIINEYPKYREIAGVFYFLGHAYNDSGRIDEAQQVWRSLVCHNKYAYPTPADPKDPEKDTIKPLPQDADEAHWTAWRNKYREPKSVSLKNPETVYIDPFPR